MDKIFSGLMILFFAVGCSTPPATSPLFTADAKVSKRTSTQQSLIDLVPASSKVPVAVYGFEDKTGQFKPTEAGQTLSRAVSQGADSILIKALQDAGDRGWFTVIERGSLNNLLKERQIIAEMRQRYLGETQVNPQALPPLLFAGVLLEGGVVGFDTNIQTGGAAARYLGIGGQTNYRQNVVSVYLRAVSVKTGEVMASVTTEKTIASVGVAGNAFRFVTFDNILEADVGYTSNEPGLLALRQAIEKSVYSLILEGADVGLWSFQDRLAGAQLINKYRQEAAGIYGLAGQDASPQPRLAADGQRTDRVAKRQSAVPVAARSQQARSQADAAQVVRTQAARTQAIRTRPTKTQATRTQATNRAPTPVVQQAGARQSGRAVRGGSVPAHAAWDAGARPQQQPGQVGQSIAQPSPVAASLPVSKFGRGDGLAGQSVKQVTQQNASDDIPTLIVRETKFADKQLADKSAQKERDQTPPAQ